MSWCVIKRDNLSVEKHRGFHDKKCIGHLPSTTPSSDFKFLTIDEKGKPFICLKKKSAWMKEQIKNEQSD